MKENRFFQFSKEEIILAMNIVTDVLVNATKSSVPDEDGIYLNINEFIKYISYDKAEKLIKMLGKYQKYDIYKDLDKKVLDWITED